MSAVHPRQSLPRAKGVLCAEFARNARGAYLARHYESGGLRLRCPRKHDEDLHAALINTAGGVVGGDHLRYEIKITADTQLLITSQAAEKYYGSEADALIETDLQLEAGAKLDWMMPEGILFDKARLHRRLRVNMVESARLALVEGFVFGRRAMGEQCRNAQLRDQWRIYRGEKLIFAENAAIEGDIDACLQRAAIGAGACAMATFLYIADDAGERLDAARAVLEKLDGEAGASAWNGLLHMRLLARTPLALREALNQLIFVVRGIRPPRLWQ